MNYWNFTSEAESFSLRLPENWSEYNDADNSSSFFNAQEWSGNLRITSFTWDNTGIGEKNDRAEEYIQSELSDNANAILVKVGEWDAAFYSKETKDKKDVIYYWATGLKNNLFLCSFTIDKSFFNTDRNNSELTVVEEILGSIRILNKD